MRVGPLPVAAGSSVCAFCLLTGGHWTGVPLVTLRSTLLIPRLWQLQAKLLHTRVHTGFCEHRFPTHRGECAQEGPLARGAHAGTLTPVRPRGPLPSTGGLGGLQPLHVLVSACRYRASMLPFPSGRQEVRLWFPPRYAQRPATDLSPPAEGVVVAHRGLNVPLPNDCWHRLSKGPFSSAYL